ncbi:dihydropteroate synthase [Flexivirga endophytica]|uniref:Dihydropteroate synthase n=1 Tax=Flexivirga endophytica TaxID=1849103 RepID=A0A916WPM0_9MICO|nr:dihydropteroate synthase [Flexivirga endophytica]GGB22488.1 dihydropteroate synthase [Flexivirga endophytica]GHB56432.1 dihydropteroate synthase [Flexivirga endophytica]
MITLAALAELAGRYPDDLATRVAPLQIGDRMVDTDQRPTLMGVVNLSRDSSYRDSIAVSTDSAVRKAKVQSAAGADLIDVGAESTRATAARADLAEQQALLTPVIEQLTAAGIAVSVEAYQEPVARAGLAAGARVLNLTGSDDDDRMFTLAAEHDATVVLCHVLGPNARALTEDAVDTDPVPGMLDTFGSRIERARQLGVPSLAVDPGLGFGFHLDDQRVRARHQAAALLHTFRLRRLGVPVCHALPHAFDIFEDQYRSGEGFFAVLAHLGGTGVYRTHEVSLVRSVLDAMRSFGTGDGTGPAEDGRGPIT